MKKQVTVADEIYDTLVDLDLYATMERLDALLCDIAPGWVHFCEGTGSRALLDEAGVPYEATDAELEALGLDDPVRLCCRPEDSDRGGGQIVVESGELVWYPEAPGEASRGRKAVAQELAEAWERWYEGRLR